MKKTIVYSLLCLVIMFASCNSSKDLSGAYNMVKCKYSYSSVSKLKVSGVDLSSGFALAQIPMITSMLSGNQSSIPVSFDLNIDVHNPNEKPAMLQGLDYTLSIDGIQLTTGSVKEKMNINGGGTQILPLSIGVDLATLFQDNSKDAVLNIGRNMVGIGDKRSKVSLQVRPTFMIGNTPVTSPVYLPISFTFGGKKEGSR